MSSKRSQHVNYHSWRSMIKRCYDKNNNRYSIYGGRGIGVADEWRPGDNTGFYKFCEDMGDKPAKDYDLDRIDPNGDYTKENCRWVDRTTSAWNQRKYSNNLSGVVGVGWNKRNQRWTARITKNNETIFLGGFKDKDQAIAARLAAELELYGEYKIKGEENAQ